MSGVGPLGAEGLGFKILGLGLWAWDLGVQGFGFRV